VLPGRHGTTRQQHAGRPAVVGARRAVLEVAAAELRDHRDDAVLPDAHRLAVVGERQQRFVECAEQVGVRAGQRALGRVCVEAAEAGVEDARLEAGLQHHRHVAQRLADRAGAVGHGRGVAADRSAELVGELVAGEQRVAWHRAGAGLQQLAHQFEAQPVVVGERGVGVEAERAERVERQRVAAAAGQRAVAAAAHRDRAERCRRRQPGVARDPAVRRQQALALAGRPDQLAGVVALVAARVADAVHEGHLAVAVHLREARHAAVEAELAGRERAAVERLGDPGAERDRRPAQRVVAEPLRHHHVERVVAAVEFDDDEELLGRHGRAHRHRQRPLRGAIERAEAASRRRRACRAAGIAAGATGQRSEARGCSMVFSLARLSGAARRGGWRGCRRGRARGC
jgi:hypothetical protein